MSEPVRITRFEAENVKRVKAVTVVPDATGLTIIGGKNNQGKTSVLDAIAWALGGDKFRPSEPRRDGSVTPPSLRVELSNGLVVERKGKSSDLKVIDPAGNKAGQSLLNAFVEQLALDLPKFLESSPKDKAKTLLQIIGVGDRLYELQRSEKALFDERTAIGRIHKQKQAAADEMPAFPDAPAEPVSAGELIARQQEILARNGENQKKREQVAQLLARKNQLSDEVMRITAQIEELTKKRVELNTAERQNDIDLLTAQKSAQELTDESTAEIEASLVDIDTINQQVRTNQARAMALDEAETYRAQYEDLSGRIEVLRAEQLKLLDGADLPLPGLSVDSDGELTYNAVKWDGMSSSEQLCVATAIVRRLNPDCGFVLLDKLEQLDVSTLREFAEWANSESLQIISTRVTTGETGDASILIQDGYSITPENSFAQTTKWVAGEF
ncbi:MAG: AAA family ATPase [Coriobacteriales bacterium]|nr:AAA family ATPase [Coriobacteriales bacterium]